MIAPSDSDSILEITSRMPRCHLTWSDANSIRGVVLPSRGIVWSVRATSNEAKVETVSSSSLVVAVSMSVAARGKKTSGQHSKSGSSAKVAGNKYGSFEKCGRRRIRTEG
jgi:hypothetical protein